MSEWYVYILECRDGTLYTGVTTDRSRRLDEHNKSKKGAKYTRTRRPVRMVWSKKMTDRSSALKEEYRIKRLNRKEKIKLINNQQNHR